MEKNDKIRFEKSVAQLTGFLKVADDTPPDTRRQKPPLSLLQLLFHFTYTRDGRAFLAANRPSGGVEKNKARANLERRFSEFNVPQGELMNALTEAHFAADAFLRGGDEAEEQAKYFRNLETIMTALHNDAMSTEFSINW
jgi:hypothetical protein